MSDDFFTSVPFTAHNNSLAESHDSFAEAIAVRFGSADLLTARLLPGEIPHPKPDQPPTAQPHAHQSPLSLPPPLSPRASAPPQPHTVVGTLALTSVPPSALASYLSDPSTLILDIRPHAAHASARIRHALSLSVPSTLLKRPLFSLSKLTQMLPSATARARFAAWPSATRILVYDADSAVTPDNSNIAGLLRKFRAEGFSGELGWVRGGFQAVWKEARDLATTEQPSPEEDDVEATASSGTLRTKRLPKAAFSLSSTTAGIGVGAISRNNAILHTPAPVVSRAANPFFDTIRQNMELSQGITERIPLRLSRRVRRRINELPFRWLQDIACRSAVRHTASSSRSPSSTALESGSESSDDPHTSDPDENDPDVEEGAEALAMQFYRIELAEQRRLRTILEHHSKESEVAGAAATGRPYTVFESGAVGAIDRAPGGDSASMSVKAVPGTSPIAFPFSITAGVEKGTKNRYNYIWPFEHARVRLHDGRHQGSHPGKRNKGKSAERGRIAKGKVGAKGKEKDYERVKEGESAQRSRSSPRFGVNQDQQLVATGTPPGPSRHSIDFDVRTSTSGTSADVVEGGQLQETQSQRQNPPQITLEILPVADQDSRMSEPPTPVTAFPLPTPPFYTPMEISPALSPMRAWPPETSAASMQTGGIQFSLPVSSLPSFGPLPSFTLRLPSRVGRHGPPTGAMTSALASSTSLSVPLGGFIGVPGRMTGQAGDASVKLHSSRDLASPADDYVNASYVQPLGTRKRYIATQGPLPATFVDFWSLVWEQNVHVIVMLTREVENAMVKCGTYWTDKQYGPLRLELLSTSPPTSPSGAASSITDTSKQQGFFFALREPPTRGNRASKAQPAMITRTFALSNTSYPGVPPRRVTHLQYLDWPDLNVPEDPQGVLDLVKRVEQAVAESTPGPSPGESGSGSGSLSPGSGTQSPEMGSGSERYEKSAFFSSFAYAAVDGKKKRGRGWRHPELDLKTGVAAFALGNRAPVLLHCSAGVGRTGGFIAVDAVLDGIRTEMRKNREVQAMKGSAGRGVRAGVGLNASSSATSGAEGSGDISADVSTETGASGVESGGANSVPNHRYLARSHSTLPLATARKVGDTIILAMTEQESSSSSSLVVHVPYAGTTDDASKGDGTADVLLNDPQKAGWQSSSTREWAEQVSDQTHTRTEEEELPPPIGMPMSLSLLPAPSRERSPGSASSGSAPSALNSADDSKGKARVDSAEVVHPEWDWQWKWRRSTFLSVEVELRVWLGIDIDLAFGFGVSIWSSSGVESSSFMGLMRSRLHDSSATSIASTDSSLPEKVHKAAVPLRQPSAIHVNPGSDMDVDHSPRSVSVPPQSTALNTKNLQRAMHQRWSHKKPSLGLSPVASLSSPALPTTPEAQRGVSRPLESTCLTSRELESGGSAYADSAKSIELESSTNAEVGSGPAKAPETATASNPAKDEPSPYADGKCKEKATTPMPRVPRDPEIPQPSSVAVDLGVPEVDRRAAGRSVIDYKLPRELHSDLLPPLISSFADPICMVVQDMREQRMSLCQSLRQYVFVHAAVIEGALRIVDEERELWGDGGVSDEGSAPEIELGVSISERGRKSGDSGAQKAWFGGADKGGVAAMGHGQGGIRDRTRSFLTAAHTTGPWNPEGNDNGDQHPPATASPSSGVSSPPSKAKRGPSPTELFREDKTGAMSLNKRPSIKSKTSSDEGIHSSFESGVPSTLTRASGRAPTHLALRGSD
ncbi:hypothetical protein BU15DRAFT_78523 [Melanogaster broomeanus]|nr:hypothetical protein BU15DRAFT_78523 [Melanogaster broomeanus]